MCLDEASSFARLEVRVPDFGNPAMTFHVDKGL